MVSMTAIAGDSTSVHLEAIVAGNNNYSISNIDASVIFTIFTIEDAGHWCDR